ncbi:MAG: DEAD/DEAH box helicase [Chloroflexota bacterium]
MDTLAFLNHLKNLPSYYDQIVHVAQIMPRQAVPGELAEPLEPGLADSLQKNGLAPLYAHQAAAINHIRRGKNVMVATSSASGKTLCYNVAVMQSLLTAPRGRALYLFPTKALAQDQLRNLRQLFSPHLFPPEDFATFDGDTPQEERAGIRRRGRIIFSNPDMLHLGILPRHHVWAGFLRNLKYVVVDEAHIYRGVFGSHVAGVLRRLRRLCRYYGADPVFVCCSATIANPSEHAANLVGAPFEVVDRDGSPQGKKDFVFWNAPVVDKAKNIRRSANGEATFLLTELIEQGIRTLAFVRTRRLTELIYLYTRDRLMETSSALAGRIRPYRAGYLPEDRRRIERELFNGELLGVVATNALELGIDIGTLEATVLTGYPGSIASTWQQAGRSGRSREASISFLVARNDPLDQYLVRHPDFLSGRKYENALVNPSNPYILLGHLLCAAWEKPLDADDTGWFGEAYVEVRDSLVAQGLLVERRGKYYPAPSLTYPAAGISIRAATGDNFAVVNAATGELLETVESSTAFFQIHPGAIYLHQGDAYLITDLDLATRTASARPTDAGYYTITRDFTDIHVRGVKHRRKMGGVTVCLGDVDVTTEVVGFKKKAQLTEEVIGEEALDLPAQTFPTVALWFDLPPKAIAALEKAQLDFAGGLHALEHAAIGILPLFALCDRNDIGGVSTPLHPDTGRAQVFIYDAYPGGVGIAEKGFDMIRELWQATNRAIAECPCQDGCPSCIQSPKCGNNNQPLDKEAAKLLLKGLLEIG